MTPIYIFRFTPFTPTYVWLIGPQVVPRISMCVSNFSHVSLSLFKRGNMSGTKNRSSCVGCGGSLQIMDDKYMYTHPNSWGSGSWHVDVSDEEAGYFHWRWLACRRGHRCIDPITYINGWYCLQCQLPTEGEERGWGLCKASRCDLDEMKKCWKHLFDWYFLIWNVVWKKQFGAPLESLGAD